MSLSIKPLSGSNLLSAVLALDGLLFLGFGLASWFAPLSTFGTIVDLSGAGDHSLILAILSSLSIFYILIGLVCFLAVFIVPPYKNRVAVLMAIGHICSGLKGYEEIGREWLVGNPWPDIVIHSVFVFTYIILVFVIWRRSHARCLEIGNGSA